MTMHDLPKKALAALAAAALILPDAAVVARAADAAAPAPAAAPSAPVKAVFSGVEIGDDLVTIKLSTAVQYNSFLTQTPPRLVLELLDVKHDAANRVWKGQGRYLAGVRTSQYQRSPRMVTRVVLDLIKMAVYKISADPKGLAVQLAGAGEAAQASNAPSAPEVPGETPAAAPVAPAPKAPAIAPKGARAAHAAHAAAPAPAAKPVPAAPVAAAPAPAPAPVEKPAVAEVKPRDNSAAAALKRAGLAGKVQNELVASVEGEDVTKEKAVIPEQVEEGGRDRRALGGRIFRDLMSQLPRDRVSLDFDNTDVRDVIKLLSAKSRINIIYGSDVQGTLTLHLTDVPFNEAFRTVLSMMGLSTDQVGDNILRVITPAELTKQRTSAGAITKVIPLNYAKASAVKATIDSVRTAEGRNGSSSVDANSNALIVTDTLEGMLADENLIAQLDQRPRQVLIEAKLVELNTNSSLNYGVQWDYTGVEQGKIGGKAGTTSYGSPIGLASPVLNQPMDGGALQGNILTTGGTGASGRGTGVNLAADKIFGALTLGRITNNYLINATLTAAAAEGKAKVLSDPKIATLNNQPANINVTTQIPYVTSNVASTGVQTQSVSYVTTGIQLTVTPSINADGRILLNVTPSVSQPSVTAAANTQTGAPAVDTRNAQTSVLVRDGETIVIGGLISDSLQDTISKVPILGDIPILGWLFKKKSKSRVRNELLIFVTTKILPD